MFIIKDIYSFYIEGFKNMKIGKTLWKIIFIKLILIFTLLNYVIYDKSMKSEYQSSEDRSNFVYKNLIKTTE